jgi:hypothetical protein
MTVDKMSIFKMTVEIMPMDKIPVDERACSQNRYLTTKRRAHVEF